MSPTPISERTSRVRLKRSEAWNVMMCGVSENDSGRLLADGLPLRHGPGRRVYNYPKDRAIHSFSNSKVQSHKRSVHGFRPAGSGFWPVRPSWRSRRISSPTRMTPRILIFDTTLRDGEQAPRCSMLPKENLSIAHQPPPLPLHLIQPAPP